MDDIDDLVATAEALHRQTGRLARGTRRWRRLRERGHSMTEVVRSGQNRALLQQTADVAKAAADLLGRLRATVIHALSREGWSRRQLAELIGVTHQRVSKIARPVRTAVATSVATDRLEV